MSSLGHFSEILYANKYKIQYVIILIDQTDTVLMCSQKHLNFTVILPLQTVGAGGPISNCFHNVLTNIYSLFPFYSLPL